MKKTRYGVTYTPIAPAFALNQSLARPWVWTSTGKLKPPGHSRTSGTVEGIQWPRVEVMRKEKL